MATLRIPRARRIWNTSWTACRHRPVLGLQRARFAAKLAQSYAY